MIKIDFSSIKLYKDLSKANCVISNIRKDVANDLYTHGQGIAFHALALKIYNGQCEQEFTDEEYNIIMSYANQMCTPQVIDALRLYGEKKEE